MNRILKLIAGAMMFAVFAGSANAVSTTFDFRYPGGLGGVRQGDSSLLFVLGALEVEVRGYRLEDYDTALEFQTATDESAFVGQNSNGIIFDRPYDGHVIDGKGSNEVVTFTFNRAVSIKQINFDYANGYFRAFNDLDFDGPGFTGTEVFSGPVTGNGPNGFDITNFNPDLGPSTTFAVGAFGDYDSFKIRTLTVHAIPEPATWLMMIIGFAIVGLARKRRQQQVLA